MSEQKPDTQSAEPGYSVLVFTKTAGWRHDSIPEGIQAVQELGTENGFTVNHTEDSTAFTSDNLAQYAAVIFLNTTQTLFDEAQREAFRSYIQAGGGFVGVHSATDTEYDWPWYGELVGAYFDSHPHNQTATVRVVDRDHPSTRHLEEEWERYDEWYNFNRAPDHVNVLAYLDVDSFEGSNMGDNHPIVWYHEFDGGRAWYTGLGHTKESYEEPLFLQHLLGGIQWAAGVAE